MNEGVLLDARHENVARALIGGVKRDGERKLLGLIGKTLNHGDNAAGGHREVARANPRTFRRVEAPQRGERSIVVHHGLALPHHHNAGNTRVEVITHVHDLLVDLASGQRAGKARGAGCAERTAHGTACLRGHAHGKAVLRGHANALNGNSVREAKQVLAATVLRDLPCDLLDASECDVVRKLGSQRLGQVGHLVE